MTPDRWARIQEVFAAALEREPPARAAFIGSECRDDADLRREVESLLASNDAASSRLLDSPAAAVMSTIASDAPKSGSQPALTRGKHVGAYEILAPLGAGGMGEVYRARDPKLKRDVAIKVLPRLVGADPDALARFEREALAVAALSHPNILAIHDFGTDDGVAYAVMELLEGETLREKLNAGPITAKLAVDYALQIGRGLSAAHDKGVVHRDLKPENLFVTRDGHLKILDFGLAKRVGAAAPGEETSAPTETEHTQPGTVMGTVGYMSPEQVRGLPVDHRSDIFSFGTILYEMLSGKRAFKRDTAADTMAAILKEEPPAFLTADQRVSPGLDRVVRRCLEKEKAQRFHSAQDIVFALQDTSAANTSEAGPEVAAPARVRRPINRSRWLWAAGAVGVLALSALLLRFKPWVPSIASLAVLPFANANSDASVEYLNDGLTDALINSLGHLPNLRVMSRDAVSGYKKKDATAQEAGRELHVQAVLKGKFTQQGEDLVVTAELVDVRDNSHLWGGRFDRKLADMQALQDDMAVQVSARLRARLSGEETRRMTKRHTDNPTAYQLYLKGRYAWEKRTEEQLRKSVDYFTQAIDLDPGFAEAYAGLSGAYGVSPSYSALSPRESFPKSKAAAARALEIDDTIAQAHSTLGWALWAYDWNYPAAEEEMKKAVALNPNDATVHHWYGLLLVALGRTSEAVAELRRAVEIDPFSRVIQMNLSRAYANARQFDAAIEEAGKAPDFPLSHNRLGDAYMGKGMLDQAAKEYRKAFELSGKNAQGLMFRGQAEILEGRRDDALRTIEEMKVASTQRYIAPAYIAALYVRMGDKENGFEWLEKAYEDHSFDLAFLKVAPVWDPVRSDPRFQDLLRRLRLVA